ncbi:hypothetical protein D3C74_415860 [compost metagenome]
MDANDPSSIGYYVIYYGRKYSFLAGEVPLFRPVTGNIAYVYEIICAATSNVVDCGRERCGIRSVGRVLIFMDWHDSRLHRDISDRTGDREICLCGTVGTQTSCATQHGVDSEERVRVCLSAQYLPGGSVRHY